MLNYRKESSSNLTYLVFFLIPDLLKTEKKKKKKKHQASKSGAATQQIPAMNSSECVRSEQGEQTFFKRF